MARKKPKVEKSEFSSQINLLNEQTATQKKSKDNESRKTIKSTIYAYEDQWRLLESRSAQSKTDTNKGLSRTQTLRALVDFFIEVKPDLKQY